jgi:coenzyme F420-reducing hydrogenase gamma subunit
MAKPRLAFFSFASCEGCQLQFLNLEDEILDILPHVDIVEFREAIDNRSDDYDVAFVEGSITRPADEAKVKKIRERAKVLIAFGACATTGGVNRLKNFVPPGLQETTATVRDPKGAPSEAKIIEYVDGARRIVYGDQWNLPVFDTYPTRSVAEVVKVDYRLEGCPAAKKEILELVKALLQGRAPRFPRYPVCVDCKLAENVCLFHKGQFCLGVVTRAGCDQPCPSFGNRCVGCRGLIDDPNKNAAWDILAEIGLKPEDILREFRLFQAYAEEAEAAKK